MRHAVSDEEREAIREALVAAGAPDRDLSWLTESCPSLRDALTYRSPVPRESTLNTFNFFTALEEDKRKPVDEPLTFVHGNEP